MGKARPLMKPSAGMLASMSGNQRSSSSLVTSSPFLVVKRAFAQFDNISSLMPAYMPSMALCCGVKPLNLGAIDARYASIAPLCDNLRSPCFSNGVPDGDKYSDFDSPAGSSADSWSVRPPAVAMRRTSSARPAIGMYVMHSSSVPLIVSCR